MVRPAVLVGYPRIDLALALCLICSGPSIFRHLVIWFARVLLLWFSSPRFDLPPRMYPPHCIARSLVRMLSSYNTHRSLVPSPLSISLPTRLHHFLDSPLALWLHQKAVLIWVLRCLDTYLLSLPYL